MEDGRLKNWYFQSPTASMMLVGEGNPATDNTGPKSKGEVGSTHLAKLATQMDTIWPYLAHFLLCSAWLIFMGFSLGLSQPFWRNHAFCKAHGQPNLMACLPQLSTINPKTYPPPRMITKTYRQLYRQCTCNFG